MLGGIEAPDALAQQRIAQLAAIGHARTIEFQTRRLFASTPLFVFPGIIVSVIPVGGIAGSLHFLSLFDGYGWIKGSGINFEHGRSCLYE